MKPVLLSIIPFCAATILALLASCAYKTVSDAQSLGGSGAGSVAPSVSGSGGLAAGASSSAGIGAGGVAGESAAGVGGSVTAGMGAAGSTGDDAIPPTFQTVKLVLQGGGAVMPCAAAPCHGVHGMAPPGDPLELPPNDDQQLYANLTTYVSKACGNLKLVEPGNTEQSAILKILSGPCGMTPRMPYMCSAADGNCIPDEYIDAISRWIANGASQQ